MGWNKLLFTNPVAFIVLSVLLLYSIIAHEIAHGWVAYFFGDTTAKNSGRLSLNPFLHLDPVGTFALLFVGIGWAKPVPINFSTLRNPRIGLFCVSLAGVAINIAIAALVLFLLKLRVFDQNSTLGMLLHLLAEINLILGAFNLIPIPPLDGSKILMVFFPQRLQRLYMKFDLLGFVLLIILLKIGALDPVIRFIRNNIASFIGSVPR